MRKGRGKKRIKKLAAIVLPVVFIIALPEKYVTTEGG